MEKGTDGRPKQSDRSVTEQRISVIISAHGSDCSDEEKTASIDTVCEGSAEGNKVESLRNQLKSSRINQAANGDDRNCGNEEDRRYEPSKRPQINTLHDELDFRLPSPPSASPQADNDRELEDRRHEPSECPQTNTLHDELDFPPSTDRKDRKDCAPVSADNDGDSISSSLSERDSYTWSLASCDLPLLLSMNDGKERLIWPVEEEFPNHNGFEENIDYILRVRIAKGAFGECHLAVELPEDQGREFCVKKCKCDHINELLALTVARKENVAEIVQFYGAKLKGRNATIFMEFMSGGTISELIANTKKEAAVREVILTAVISETFSLGYLEDVLKALNFIHIKGIVHRDVKGGNVLLNEDRYHVKLADFGSAGSRNTASTSIDIWKTGCLFLEMWNGKRSRLLGVSERGFQRQNSCKPEDYIPSATMQETKDLLRLCFGVNTAERHLPSAAEILKISNIFPVKNFLRRL